MLERLFAQVIIVMISSLLSVICSCDNLKYRTSRRNVNALLL